MITASTRTSRLFAAIIVLSALLGAGAPAAQAADAQRCIRAPECRGFLPRILRGMQQWRVSLCALGLRAPRVRDTDLRTLGSLTHRALRLLLRRHVIWGIVR